MGTFNAYLFRGALDFVERKDTLIEVVSYCNTQLGSSDAIL